MAAHSTVISKSTVEGLLDAEKLKYCYECGICTGSCPMVELLGKEYNPRGLLEKVVLNADDVLSSEELWFCAWCYRCYRRCNQALRLPEIFLTLRKTAAKNGYTEPLDKALQKIVENVPLPLVTTSVCFHPERAGVDRERVLEKVESLYADHLNKAKAKRAQQVLEERIAIIGSGPAGLAVSGELSKKGYGVTVFEQLPEAGGMLRKCIPDYRLPKQVLNREIQFIMDLGVEIKTGTTVGQDSSFSNLRREGYKAVFVGVGAHKNQKLRIEGSDLKGVVHALEFLCSVNFGQKVEIGNNVMVVGGGNVGVDAAKTVLGLGAKNVTIVYRRSREEMPAIPWEVREAEEAGVKIEFLVSPTRILGKDGKVVAVECTRMELGEPDDSGRRRAVPIKDSEFKREADTVILAIGEAPDLEFLPKEIELNEDGTVWADPVTMETSVKGVFAGGDAVTGPATVIEAVLAGKRAAKSIEAFLRSPKG